MVGHTTFAKTTRLELRLGSDRRDVLNLSRLGLLEETSLDPFESDLSTDRDTCRA